jgi:hypothetical protein
MRRLHATGAMIAAVLLACALVSGGTTAAAGVRTKPGPPPVLPVHVRPEGFTIPGPNPRPGGPVTFRVTAEGAHGYWWNAYKLLNGATIEQFVEWLEKRSNPDPAVSLPAMQALYTNVEWAGGAKVYPNRPLELTQTLTPGTYYFGSLAIPGPQGGPEPADPMDRAAAMLARTGGEATAVEGEEPSVFGYLDVTDEYRPARQPQVDGTILMFEAQGRDVMIVPRDLPARGRLLVLNRTLQPQETVFMDLAPGATDRAIAAYFKAEREGAPLPPRPFYDSIGGMLSISPNKQIIMGYELPSGRYGIFSWLRDAYTGVDSAANGMHAVVTLR